MKNKVKYLLTLMTPTELGAAIGVSASTVAYWAKDEHEPHETFKRKVVELFDTQKRANDLIPGAS